jgi:phage I-like protein
VATCRAEGGLEQFKKFVASAPKITAESGLEGKVPQQVQTALNAEQALVMEMFGNSAEDLAKYGN